MAGNPGAGLTEYFRSAILRARLRARTHSSLSSLLCYLLHHTANAPLPLEYLPERSADVRLRKDFVRGGERERCRQKKPFHATAVRGWVCTRTPDAPIMDTKSATYGTLPSGKESGTSVFPVNVQGVRSSLPSPGAADEPKTTSKETEKLIWNPSSDDTGSNDSDNSSNSSSSISSCTTIFLVVNYMIGSGILNTPQTFKESGIAATTVLYILAGVFARISMNIWTPSAYIIGMQQ